jgi:hypothetical protein
MAPVLALRHQLTRNSLAQPAMRRRRRVNTFMGIEIDGKCRFKVIDGYIPHDFEVGRPKVHDPKTTLGSLASVLRSFARHRLLSGGYAVEHLRTLRGVVSGPASKGGQEAPQVKAASIASLMTDTSSSPIPGCEGGLATNLLGQQ